MLLLPTGQVLYNGWPAGLQIFTDPGSPDPAWAPTITSVPTALAAGHTYTLDGDQLNGLSDGAAFGDDYQSSTDYPLVQITNDNSGTVTYARTRFMANRSIAPRAFSCTNFTVPSSIPTGTSELRVIANGIASAPVEVSIGSTGANTTSCVPILVARPVVSGVAGVSQLLTSSPGTWTNATTYAYQWQRCTPAGSGCTNISDATASTYTPTNADVGSELRSTVQARNGNSIADAVASDQTAVVVAAPAPLGRPRIRGKPRVGKPLRASHGTWSGPPTSYEYRWLRCARSGGHCRAIAGAARARYELTKRDAGHRLRIRVTAADAAGATRTASKPTRVVAGRRAAAP